MRRTSCSRLCATLAAALVLVGCGDGTEAAPTLTTDGGSTAPDASTPDDSDITPPKDEGQPPPDPGTPLADTPLPPLDLAAPNVCSDGSIRCAENKVWECKAGAWGLLQDCGEVATCVHGQCVCAPVCDSKECGPDGCGGSCGSCVVGGQCTPEGKCSGDTPGPEIYTAVYVEDIWGGNCSGYNSSGADIRGASLTDPSGQMVGYWDEVVAKPGTEGCQNDYTNSDIALGAPTQDQLSLQGGWVAGTFEGKNAIGPGWSFTVYEFDSQVGGSSETFAVWLMTDLECPKKDNPKSECMVPVSEAGKGTTTFEVKELP